MRRYELVLVASPVLSEEDADKQVTSYESLIQEMGGTIQKVDRWGRRRLAYSINKHAEGNYTLFLYDGEANVEKELTRRLKLSDTVLRFLSVRADHEKTPSSEEKLALEEARKDYLRRAAERAAAEAAGLPVPEEPLLVEEVEPEDDDWVGPEDDDEEPPIRAKEDPR
jgi:small subunit ribosomal protein S6